MYCITSASKCTIQCTSTWHNIENMWEICNLHRSVMDVFIYFLILICTMSVGESMHLLNKKNGTLKFIEFRVLRFKNS